MADAYTLWIHATQDEGLSAQSSVPEGELDGNCPQHLRVVDLFSKSFPI